MNRSKLNNRVPKQIANVLIAFIIVTLIQSVLVPPVFANNDNPAAAAQGPSESVNIDLIQSGFIDSNHGYMYTGANLYWTEDSGAKWTQITPAGLENATVRDIQFTTPATGYVLTTIDQEDGIPSFEIFETVDSGSSWLQQSLDLPYPDSASPSIDKAYLFLLENTWWISIKVSSSSNFSIGLLFRTDDAGISWRLQPAPLGEPVYFVTPDSGWMAGGAAGDELFRTNDGGDSWESVVLPEVDGLLNNSIQTPHFYSPADGVLVDLAGTEQSQKALVFTTSDGGDNWSVSSSVDLENVVSQAPIAYPEDQPQALIIADGTDLVKIKGKGIEHKKTPSGLNESPNKIFFSSDQSGFAEINLGNCTQAGNSNKKDGYSCKKEFKILQTNDGGSTWSAINLPTGNQKSLTQTLDFQAASATLQESSSIPSLTKNFIGQGFDKCELATSDQLSDWYANSPYRAVNLYIGGKSRACANSLLTASYLQSLSQKGWSFIPTWVGYQAPCTNLSNPMSSKVTIAYGQGVEEARSAIEQLFVLGLSNSDKSGSVVYYDMEYYNGGDTACSAAVSAFMDGWTAQLHGYGIFSGIYGSTYNNQLSNIFAVPNPPDVIWPARWYIGTPSYRQDASVWDIPDLSNSIYNNHQRIRQYYGGHTETWGSTSMAIDNNVLDGVVATPQQTTVPACPPTSQSESYVCAPTLAPAYTNTCESRWFPISGFNGLTSYLAENVKDPANPTNISSWTPNLQADGYYRVEAFIPSHGSNSVTCSSTFTYGKDSSKAKYLVTSKDNTTSSVLIDQLPINNDWVSLGIFSFGKGGNGGSVTLTNATSEDAGSTNISAGAVRFIAVDPKLSTISPTARLVNEPGFTLTITGQNFSPTVSVRWNGSDRPTTFINSNTITAQIPDTDLKAAVVASITVFDPSTSLSSSAAQLIVSTYADALPASWYWRYVEGFSAKGITTGCNTGPLRYCPDRAVTRAEMAVFILRSQHADALPYTPNPVPSVIGAFSDVPAAGKGWMQPWIEEFYQTGMTNGCNNAPLSYCPERQVTRAEMAVFVLRAIHGKDYVPPAATGVFSDVPAPGKQWMQPWIEQFYREGITTGCGQSPLRFCPEQPVTRAEMATFIDRAFGFPQLP